MKLKSHVTRDLLSKLLWAAGWILIQFNANKSRSIIVELGARENEPTNMSTVNTRKNKKEQASSTDLFAQRLWWISSFFFRGGLLYRTNHVYYYILLYKGYNNPHTLQKNCFSSYLELWLDIFRVENLIPGHLWWRQLFHKQTLVVMRDFF